MLRVLLHAFASGEPPALLSSLAEALTGLGHEAELKLHPLPRPAELDPCAYADVVEQRARVELAASVRRLRPDAIVVCSEDAFALAERFPLPHPRTVLVGPAAVTLDAPARRVLRHARSLVIGRGRALGGVAALADGLSPDEPLPDGAVDALVQWIESGASALEAWRATLERPRASRRLFFTLDDDA